MTRIDPEGAHTANVSAPDASQAPGDATLLERRSAALNRVAAENDRLRAAQSMWGDAMKSLNEWRERAEAAEAKLRDVEALLPDEWHEAAGVLVRPSAIRAVLARSQAPQAPAPWTRP